MLKNTRCSMCQRFFWPIKSNQKYCSVCKKKKKYYVQKPLVQKKCPNCNKPFKTRRQVQVYCSTSCKSKFHYDGKKEAMVCERCGNIFYTAKSFQVYCSHNCYLTAKSERDHQNYLRRKK